MLTHINKIGPINSCTLFYGPEIYDIKNNYSDCILCFCFRFLEAQFLPYKSTETAET